MYFIRNFICVGLQDIQLHILIQTNYTPLAQTAMVYFVMLFIVNLLPSELGLLAKFAQRQYSS